MSLKKLRFSFLVLALALMALGRGAAWAQHDAGTHGPATGASVATDAAKTAHQATGKGVGSHGTVIEEHAGGHEEAPGTFAPHYGTWLNPVARLIFGEPPVRTEIHDGQKHFKGIDYDFITVALFIMLMIGLAGVLAARRMKLRPDGKPMSLSHVVETLAEGFRNYLVGVMGEKLAFKYAPLITSFFFTILCFNYMGQIPGMTSPTANPNVPVAFAIMAFFSVHVIAIKEAGFKSWFMHLVGEPIWLAPLNFPLHLIGELIKPMSLAMRLLGNIFGEEMVVFQLITLSMGIGALFGVLPIPLHLPMVFLGMLFGLLQALVFSTLLAIYISILGTHHGDHDEHNAHGHVEHHDDGKGGHLISGHSAEATIA